VAVLGMRDETHADTPAYQIPALLKERGLRVIPINPKLAAALGEPSLKAVGELREAVDILDVFRRPEFVAAHADEILALPVEVRPRVVWLQTGIRDDGAAARLAAEGIRVVQDKCLGVYAARYRPKP
jgi:predicted CoA-binding protein